MSWRSVIRLRKAVVEDASSILWLIQLLAEYENEPNAPKLEGKDLVRDCFGEDKYHHFLVAELRNTPVASVVEPTTGLPSDKMDKNESLVGYGFYYYNYTTWQGKILYLEDVFVREKYRNMGLGTAIMRECAKFAKSNGCARMKYQVLDWNTKAQDLYKRLGGEIFPPHLTMRMYREDIAKLLAQPCSNESWKEAVTIRPCVPKDLPEVVELIQLLADYLRESHGPQIGEKELLQDGFNGEKYYSILVAEKNSSTGSPCYLRNKLAGFVLHCFSYSTWEGKQMYVEDIFVREDYRNMGLGRALMTECAKVAAANNCARIYWHVFDWNTKAISFYERLGAQCEKEWLTVNMYRDALSKFASEQSEQSQH